NELTDRGADVPRKTRDRRLQGSLDKTSGAYTLGYGYAYRTTDNLVTDISSSEQSHRWRMARAASPVLGNRLRMGGSYTFAYRERRDERSGPGGVLELIPAGVGLYREDPSPEQDPLAPVGGLTDGDTQNAVEPVIDIGGALVDRNIGVDLAFERGVDAIYLYVDRPSGPLTWRVFTSVDNLNWAQVSGVTAFFNAALQRYEISFAQTRTRYLKVVNGGLNSAAEVFVTEIEALAQVTGQAESMRFHRSHLADLTAFYSVTRNLSTQAGLTFQDEPPQGGESQHRTLGYLVSSRYHQSRMIEHDVRWEQGFQFLGEGGEDQIDQTVSYGLRVDPWATLGLAVGAAHRKIRIESRDYQEDNNVSLRLRGEPLRGWGFRVETTRSRSLQYVAGTRADTWNQRVATDITLTDAIRTTLSGTHQWTRSEPDEDTRRRWTYRADLELRPTRTIFLRGSLDVLDDDLVDTWGREATLIWTPAPKLSASASASLHDSSTDFDTRRYDTNVTYRVNPRTSVYFQSNRIDFSGAGGSDTASYQVGLRTGF
ncbi:MAG: hypothetical protein KC729_16225, partial [Candidatus Eisenbacteria bacterium]|nr:hypothetical protein [Candidatus Eisenbacteria bacterium]